MKKKIDIRASFDQPVLLKHMVEKLAYKKSDESFSQDQVLGEWQLVNTSCIEKYASGTVEFSFGNDEQLRIPFVTRFIFSCTRQQYHPYQMSWGMSCS
ncbi:MAG: hypothetical protein ACXWV0_10595 [Flavisolibacter sp.]